MSSTHVQADVGWEEPGEIKKAPIMVSLIIGAFFGILNETLLNVAYMDLTRAFGVSEATVQWLSTAFMLVVGILIPTSALLIQWFTTRQLFLGAMSLFAIGTVICGIAPSFLVLFVGRLIQACGTGLIIPIMMNTILVLFPPEKRGGAMGTIGLVIMFAPAIGPTLSGLIVDTLNWRWLFYINIPFAFLSLIFAGIYLKNVTEVTKPKIDVISIILSTVGFGGMIFGFSSAGETDKDWFSTEVYGSLIAGAIALILFVWRQLKMEEPILDVRAFRFPMFSLTVVLLMIIMMTMFSTMIILPLYLQGALMLPAFVAGLALLPGGVLNGLLSPVIGRLFDRIGPRALMIPGALILVGVTWVFANVSTTMSVAVFIVLHSLLMIAVAMMMMPGQTNGLNDLPRKYYPHGTAIINTLLQVAGAIGVALFISIMTSGRARFLEQVEDPSAYGVQAEAMNAGVQSTFTVGFIFAVISLVITLFMKRTASPEKTEPHGM